MSRVNWLRIAQDNFVVSCRRDLESIPKSTSKSGITIFTTLNYFEMYLKIILFLKIIVYKLRINSLPDNLKINNI